MNGLDTIRQAMTAFLTEQGVAAVTAWPDETRTRRDQAVAAVSLRRCEGGPSGFQDYLGERYNQEAGRWEELYGKKLTVTFGLDLYAPKTNGADLCQAAFDRMATAFQQGGPAGLAVESCSRGETAFDQTAGLFHCPAEAVCQCYLYAVADEGGTFLDFEVKGVRV